MYTYNIHIHSTFNAGIVYMYVRADTCTQFCGRQSAVNIFCTMRKFFYYTRMPPL